MYMKNYENLRNFIKNVLFEIGKDIKIHKIDDKNIILEIDYDKYADQILEEIKRDGS